jgi:hypothetical protein
MSTFLSVLYASNFENLIFWDGTDHVCIPDGGAFAESLIQPLSGAGRKNLRGAYTERQKANSPSVRTG